MRIAEAPRRDGPTLKDPSDMYANGTPRGVDFEAWRPAQFLALSGASPPNWGLNATKPVQQSAGAVSDSCDSRKDV
jgi:hypothetical protein